jgi:Na+-transporting methylmalonyl-CoA/oxaloacetate decarboxylase gamma subunit
MVYNVSTNLILWRQIMLTNNKKSYFVKGIAVLMAMLMVLSVCLTGCGKKADEAIQKAENAQTSADEAKTAADAVYAALADYLKTADGHILAAPHEA